MKKVGIIFGGNSTEHDISILSAKSIFINIDRNEYCVNGIYIDKKGIWYEYDSLNLTKQSKITNVFDYIQNFDVVFPVLHGKYGEDGTIQGMLDMLNVPYVGCGVLASSICMDKVYSKIIFKQAGFNQADYIYLKKEKNKYIYVDENFEEKVVEYDEIFSKVEEKLKFPVYVKPSNSGSSIGITKVENSNELQCAIDTASKHDNKILIEENIKGRELECGILQTDKVVSSYVGEIVTSGDFYDYDFKYKSNENIIVIPANIPESISYQIQSLAIKAFKAVDAKGIARVDFFLSKNDKIYINEINTMPGFTNSSMYPKLFEKDGVEYKELISKLIESSIRK